MNDRWLIQATLWVYILSWGFRPRAAESFHDPDSEMRSLQVAEGYQINLFAAEPVVVKPIQMQFDPRGRLWVLCTTVYPQIQPGQKPSDSLVILEDTDGDGKADKSTEFAGGLMIPTGLALGDGGAYVGHGTELIHLKDTDGDDRADQTRVVLSGFGTGDSHQNINSFAWSPGGGLFFCQGHNIYSKIETAEGIKRLDRAGAWRFRPGTLELASFFHESSGPLNPWGILFDTWGQPFLVDGCCIGVFYLLPVLVPNKPTERFQELWKGKKICGADFLSGRHYSEDEQGILVGGTFFNNSVGRWRITEDGSGFAAKELPPLIESTNRAFRIVDVKVGPDGAIYLADWYNPIIGHYQYSFRHPDRDKTHGRIWRVTKKDRPLAPRPKLAAIPPEQLLDHLKAPENYTRHQARRRLADLSPQQLVPFLQEWFQDLDPKDPAYEHHLLEALMVYESQDHVEGGLLVRLLRGQDFRVRAYATRVLGRWHSRLNSALSLLQEQIRDSHARVRLEAVVALNSIPSARSMEIALMAADQPMDRFLDYALRQAVQGLKPHWGPAFQEGRLKVAESQQRLEFLIKADGSAESLQALLKLIRSGTLARETRENFFKILANAGGPAELRLIFEPGLYTDSNGYDADLHAKILPALSAAERLRKVRPEGELTHVLSILLASSVEPLRAEALRLAGVWKQESFRPLMSQIADSSSSSKKLRRAAIEGLALLGGNQSRNFLDQLAQASGPESMRSAAIAGLAIVDLPEAAKRAAEVLANPTEVDPAEVFSAFLQRSSGAEALSQALKQRPPASDAAKLGLRLMNSVGRQDALLVSVLTKAAGLEGEIKQLSKPDVKALAAEVRQNGDRKRGEAIFRRPDLGCLACHIVGSEGGRIGPDLNSIGTGQPIDFIIGAILTPNQEIKEGYTSFEVTTKDGEVYQGYKVREDNREWILRDVLKNEDIRIRTDNIQKQRALGSLMPAGLVTHLTRAEFRDLVRYLSELGAPAQQQR